MPFQLFPEIRLLRIRLSFPPLVKRIPLPWFGRETRPETAVPLTAVRIDAILDRLCEIGLNQRIHFLWRPFLNDPKDDMVFETALAARAAFIVTFNLRDFEPAARFGIDPVLPRDFLLKL